MVRSPTVRIRVIGTAEVRGGRALIKPDSMVLFALALYLGLNAGERVARTQLLDLFWPTVEDRSRRHALRQLLYRLRRNGLQFAQDGDELLLERSQVESDLDDLLDANWPDVAAPAAIAAASAILPGYEPALPERFRDWLDAVRSRVDGQYRRAVLRQIVHARREGRWSAVGDWAGRCLAADPLNEEATLASAEAAAMTGAKAGALQILDDYLWELGDRARVIGLPAKLLHRRISEQGATQYRGDLHSVPLVGRAREIARLNELLDTTLQRRGAAVLVVGAPGIGKSALVTELVESSAMRGWTSAASRLQASDAHRPLALFVDLFTVVLTMPGALGCAPDSLLQLRRLTRHDVADPSENPKSQEAEAVQARIRAAAIDLLGSVCEEGPLLVVLEDLHWSDEASVRLLQHLVDHTRELPVLWVLTARPEGRYTAIREALPEDVVPALHLAPLRADDAVSLLRALASPTVLGDDASLTEIADRLTGGNPLFIREIARHYVETTGAGSLPQSLRSLIRDRASRLTPVARHVLHTCAILGRYSSVPRVVSVLEIGTAELLACIEELDTLGILGVGRDSNALALHDLWQEELLSSMRSGSRHLLHHRCALVLEAECAMSRSSSMIWEAARHFVESGANTRAVRLLEGCAQHLLENGLPEDAAETYSLAFGAATTDAERFEALNGRLVALNLAGKWVQIGDTIDAAIALAARDPRRASQSGDLELLRLETRFRLEDDPHVCLDRAASLAADPTASAAHRAGAGSLAVMIASNLGRYAELFAVHRALAGIRCQSHQDHANLLTVRTVYNTELGVLEAAYEASREWVALERGSGSLRGLVRSLRFASYPLRNLGQFDVAIEYAMEALDIAETHRLVAEAAFSASVLASTCLEAENAERAEYWTRRAETWARKISGRFPMHAVDLSRAIIALSRGDVDAAQQFAPLDLDAHLADPLVRQRAIQLSIDIRILIARSRLPELERVLSGLRATLNITATTGRQDYFVASYLAGLAALGDDGGATAYARHYIGFDRRDHSSVLSEIRQLAAVPDAGCFNPDA